MYTLSSIIATLYAMVSKVQTYQFQDDLLGNEKKKKNRWFSLRKSEPSQYYQLLVEYSLQELFYKNPLGETDVGQSEWFTSTFNDVNK